MLRISIVALIAISSLLSVNSTAGVSSKFQSCPVTKPNGKIAPGQTRETMGGQWYGKRDIWTLLWPDGTVTFGPGMAGTVEDNGSMSIKSPWWKGPTATGRLSISGRRLDTPAPPLRVSIPDGYGPQFQATTLIFPTEGCWEVTGKAGEASLTFITRVIKLDAKN
jgi:hypothetical protein